MDLAGAIEGQGLVVSPGAIAFMALKTVVWVTFCEPLHESVARDFCRDRGERDEGHEHVAFDNGLLRVQGGRMQEAVEIHALNLEGPRKRPDAAGNGTKHHGRHPMLVNCGMAAIANTKARVAPG